MAVSRMAVSPHGGQPAWRSITNQLTTPGNESSSSESSGCSSDFHGDNLPSPDVLHKTPMQVWTKRGAHTEPCGNVGPFRGLGISNRGAFARDRAPMAAGGLNRGKHGGRTAKTEYKPRSCGLCTHGHTFDTHTGLNNHSTEQHGWYYSLKGDCFVPIGEADLCVQMLKVQDAQRHYWPYGAGPRSRGRATRGFLSSPMSWVAASVPTGICLMPLPLIYT